jgi:hypothetical protein
MTEIALGGVVADARVVEWRLGLFEIRDVRKADLRREDVVVDVVEMVPELDIEALNTTIREIAQDKRIADLRPERDYLTFARSWRSSGPLAST